MKGVYFDNYKGKWIAKLQKSNKVYKKGFINEDDAEQYRKELEKMCDNIIDTTDIQTVNISQTPQNYIIQPEYKTIEYRGYYQEFIERDTITGEERIGRFYVPTRRGKLIRQDNATVVILDDGSKGVAQCCSKDKFSRKIGLKYAYNRALATSLINEVKD